MLVFFGLGACRPIFQREVAGFVLSITGDATASSMKGTASLRNDDRIAPGEKIISAPEARVDLLLVPGLLIELEGNTEIEIKNLELRRDGYETTRPMRRRRATIELLRGAVTASVGRDQMHPRLIIETTAGQLSAGAGRTFRVEASDGKLRMWCLRRKINFAARDGRRIQLLTGYFAAFPPTASGPQPIWQLGAKDQNLLTQILVTEKSLLRLERQKGFGFLTWKTKDN